MICINKVFFKNELKEYTEALGSEAAAYYVLAANKGYTVEQTPDGKPSKLWKDILAATKGDRAAAIIEKAKYYTLSYLKLNGDWINNPVLKEPEYEGAAPSLGNTAVQDILQSSEYEDTKKALATNGISDDDYAMRTAVHKSRNQYMDEQDAIFSQDYIDKQKQHPTGYFAKVIAFFKSKWNKGRIKNPSAKKRDEARRLAYHEFNETLYHLNIMSIIETLRSYVGPADIQDRYNKIANVISKLYDNGDRHSINAVMAFIELADNNMHFVINNNADFYRAYSVLLMFDSDLYKRGENLFVTTGDLLDAFTTNDPSTYNAELLDYVRNFLQNFEQWAKETLSEDVLTDLKTMFFLHDDSLRCPNEEAYDAIVKGLESRLVSINRGNRGTSRDVIYNIKAKISRYKSKNMYDATDMYNIYLNFLESADMELREASKFFEDCIIKGKNIDAELLMYFKRDVLGYYTYVINNYIKTLSEENGLSEELRKEVAQMLKNGIYEQVSKAERLYESALELYTDDVVKNYVTNNMDLGDQKLFVRQAKAALKNKINGGEIGAFENFIGDPNSSLSTIVRIISNMLNNDEKDVQRVTVNRGKKLMKLYHQCEGSLSRLGDPMNYLKNFVELDDDGMPTGYFLRSINHGQFEKDLRKFEDDLRKKYHRPADERGKTIWNWLIDGTEKDYNDYHDELDDWLEKHCNRRYTASYYKARRRVLTYKVRQALNPINDQINNLYEKCTIETKDGKRLIMPNKLTIDERDRLNNLILQKKELSNPYTVIYDSTGDKVVKLEKKSGEALEIAEKIIEWNRLCGKNMKRNSSRAKFDEALSMITNPEQKTLFENMFLKEMISPEFYEQLSKCSSSDKDEDYLRICAERGKILASVKDDGLYEPDLLRLNDEAWAELKKLQEDLLKTSNPSTKKSDDFVSFDDIAEKRWIMILDPKNPQARITVLDYFKRLAQQEMLVNPNAMNEFYAKYYYRYTDKKGRDVIAPLPVFTTTYPKDRKYILKLTTGPYVEYEKSGWINSNYDDNQPEQYQPLEKLYKNKKYYEITKEGSDTKDLYDEFISIMEESISLLPTDVKMSKYKMPQITDTTASLLSRNLFGFNVRGAVGSISQHFTITENDTDLYREDRAIRPDHTVVETTPIRYIKDLTDPTKVSCDIIKTVMLFYEMANNYDRKHKTIPVVESIIERMAQTGETEQVKRARIELEMYGYGRLLKGFGSASKKMNAWQRFFTKFFNNFRYIANLGMLAGNTAAATKGLFSSMWQVLWGGNVGKYYGNDDLRFAHKLMIKDLPKAMASLGSSSTTSLLQAAMLYNGAARSISDVYGKMNSSRLRRLLGHFLMGMFTFGDYSSTAVLTGSIYHATRLVEVPNSKGEYKFVTKSQCIDMYKKAGKSGKLAKKAFKKASDNHLLNMYELGKNGEFVLKDVATVYINGKPVKIRPKFYVNKKIENRIAGTIESRASIANGVIAEHGKSKIYLGTLSRLLVVMRGFLISQGYDRLKGGDDFDEQYYNKGEMRSEKTFSEYRGLYNFETGEVEYGTIRSFGLFIKNIPSIAKDLLITLHVIQQLEKRKVLTRNDWQGVMLTIGDVVGTIVFSLLCALLFIPETRKYPESLVLAFCRMVSAGCAIETASMINIMTVLDLMTTVTTTKSFLDDVLRVFSAAYDVSPMSDTDLDDYVSSGSPYSDKPKWFRYLMKIALKPTGITGYYETFAPAIPGLEKPSSKALKSQRDAVSDFENRKTESLLDIFYDIYDIYRMCTTTRGMDSKYDYYQSKVFPATLLPKRKDPNKKRGEISDGRPKF